MYGFQVCLVFLDTTYGVQYSIVKKTINWSEICSWVQISDWFLVWVYLSNNLALKFC
jgi:hypothetical protein